MCSYIKNNMLIIRPRYFRKAVLILFGVLLTSWSFGYGNTYNLRNVYEGKPPRISKKVIYYTINFAFFRSPENFYVYYEPSIKKLVLDFYETQIEGPEQDFLGNSLFKNMEIKNFTSVMSLSGERAQILFPLDTGWHVASTIQNEKVIELTLWKKLVTNPAKPVQVKRKKSFITP